MIRLATDVGGTFTDLVGYDERTGDLFTAKSLTTPDDQSVGVLDVIKSAEKNGLRPSEVIFFAHGGTTVINAVTERRGAVTALVTTAGFRDVLEIGRGNRPDLYNLQFQSPRPFVPRHLRFEVRERLDARGNVVEALREEDIDSIIAACRRHGVEAIGIIFLHSYANPAHEIQCAALLRSALPDVTVSASHELSRQWREFERSNTVALNAFVQPIIRKYFANLEKALAAEGMTCPYYAMQSNGGISTFDQAAASPMTLVESGPSGGIAGAARVGAVIGEPDVLYLDVGGTTAKCSLIRDGRPKLASDYRLQWSRTSPGYPVQVPVADVVEIGAGGGSIAWIDAAGGLRVGPQSAGAKPGPACYRRGGSEPTVTDAMLVAGVLDPETFAEGSLKLSGSLAVKAIARVARPLGLGTEEAAQAIIDVASANMINAMKLVTVQRGHDPRDLAFVVSGGAGPPIATRLGRELSVKCTIVPPHPGIFSAWGMLAARPRVDVSKTWFSPFADDTLATLCRMFEELEREAAAYFGLDGTERLHIRRTVDVRYRGQEHSVAAPFEPKADPRSFIDGFHRAHDTAYSFHLPDTPAEVTTLHLQAELESDVIELARLATEGRSLANATRGTRAVFLGRNKGHARCPVLDRQRLPIGEVIPGPLLVEEATTTTLVLDGQSLEVTDSGVLMIKEGPP